MSSSRWFSVVAGAVALAACSTPRNDAGLPPDAGPVAPPPAGSDAAAPVVPGVAADAAVVGSVDVVNDLAPAADTRPPMPAKDAAPTAPAGPGYRMGWTATIGTPKGRPAFGSNGVHVAGEFGGRRDFGGVELTGPPGTMDYPDGQSGFLAKYSGDGKLLWVKQYGQQGVTSVGDLAVDGNGDLAIVGYFQGSPEFKLDAFVLPGPDGYGSFAARLSSSGSVIWAVDPGRSTPVVQCDGRGNTLIGGDFSYLYQKRDRTGQLVGMVKALGAPAGPARIERDAAANVYVCGNFDGTFELAAVQLGERRFVASGGNDVFLAKFDASERAIWAAVVSTPNPDRCEHLRLDGAGNPVLGTFNGNASSLVTKFDTSSGKVMWARPIRTYVRAMELADNDDVVVSLFDDRPIDLGTGTTLASAVLARFAAATGEYVVSVPYSPRVSNMARGPAGSFVLSGLGTLVSLADVLPP